MVGEIVGEVDVGEELLEELPKCILVEDLGYLYPKETSKQKARFGIYKCGFCGKHFKVRTASVKRGNTKSCGCYRISQLTKHGGKGTKLYEIWASIKARTTNKNNKRYQDYGGRGITICNEWVNDFGAFQNWSLEKGYEEDKGLSIDRIDNDGNYEPSNCRWTTITIQNRNQGISKNNKSGYKGVCFHKVINKFVAQIMVNKKQIYLGCFEIAVDGAIAYNNYIIENNLEGFILNVIPNELKDIIPERITRKQQKE